MHGNDHRHGGHTNYYYALGNFTCTTNSLSWLTVGIMQSKVVFSTLLLLNFTDIGSQLVIQP